MTNQQTKLSIAAAIIAVVIGGSLALNHVTSKKHNINGSDGSEQASADLRHSRLGTGGSHGGASSSSGKNKSGSKVHSGSGAGEDDAVPADLASIIDAATTEVKPIETEAETRERERYEEAMRNKFKYRDTDPKKVQPVELSPVLQDVTEKYDLPKNMLAAMMYVETGGTHRGGEHSMEAGYGVMNLRENNMVDTLGEGAAAIGKTKEDVLYNQKDNVEAAAALLKSYHDDAVASGLSDSEAWYTAVSTMSGRPDPELAGALADATAAVLMKGMELHLSDGGGDVVLQPDPNPPFFPKNWDLVGMNPPGNGHGPETLPGTNSPDATGYAGLGESAAGGQTVTP